MTQVLILVSEENIESIACHKYTLAKNGLPHKTTQFVYVKSGISHANKSSKL